LPRQLPVSYENQTQVYENPATPKPRTAAGKFGMSVAIYKNESAEQFDWRDREDS
jgi:hypothetical protein